MQLIMLPAMLQLVGEKDSAAAVICPVIKGRANLKQQSTTIEQLLVG